MAPAGFPEVIRHIAHADAPVAVIVGTALVQLLPAIAAGADTYADVALIPLEPIGNMLDVHGLVLHRNGLFHRDDVHADAGTTHGYAGRDLLQREERHPLEEHGQFRMLVHEFHIHVRVLGAAGNEHGHPIDAVLALVGRSGHGAVLGIFVPVVILQHTEVGQFVQQGIEIRLGGSIMVLAVEFMELVPGPVLADFDGVSRQHVQEEVQGSFPGDGIHLIFEDAGKAPVLRGFRRHLDLARDPVRDMAHELDEFRVRVLVPKVLGDELLGHFRHSV